MLRRLAALLLLAGCATAVPPRLVQNINALTAKVPHALWGIVVEDDAGRRLYEKNASTLFIPASNRKLFSGATAASCLGFEQQLTTDVFLDGNDLVLRGGGDPSFGGRWTFDRDALFAPVVAALRARGLGAIAGDVVADVSAFDRITLPPQWEIEDVGSSYATPVDALAYNENVVGIVVDDCARPVADTDPLFVPAVANIACGDARPSIASDAANTITLTGPTRSRFRSINSIANPALYAAQALASALEHAGIDVRGTVRVNTTPRSYTDRIASIASPPMWQLLSVEMKPSQNLYAEMLYKDAGGGTYDGAREAERRFLTTEVRIDPAEFRFVDGSGVSATNFVTPAAAVKLLRWMNHPARRGAWWLILATPGEEGTLHRRLTELAPRLRGKTGTLTGVNALSAIVTGTGGGTRYFSIILNHHAAGSDDAQRVIDAIAREIAAF
ncbi:MAG TPA: D-alanyl-D-alanine carboxypeptidase/D-alanyl-D-alanine-endopeptidase [Thermoanaerobaculia bacterium]|jgi:D-alanyl-D-alanine carboxypeptidase/D-alanyl-D-alanine-endopeptidase (penicillin-binding protein 4)